MINVLIADEHEILRLGLKSLLSNTTGIKVVADTSNSEDTINAVRKQLIHVVMLDTNLPGLGCVLTAERLIRLNPDLKIVGTAFYDEMDPELSERLMQSGATGYISKRSDQVEIVNAIRKVYTGQRYLSPDSAQQMALQKLDARHYKRISKSLSNREYEVMKRIVKGERAVEMAKKLCLSAKTINTYRYRIFNKLKLENDVELTLAAIRDGLLPYYFYHHEEVPGDGDQEGVGGITH